MLLELTPGEYKKWVSPGVKYACKLFGVSIAYLFAIFAAVLADAALAALLPGLDWPAWL